jgi:xanthine/uracil/vitamin C permease (AzgA family)
MLSRPRLQSLLNWYSHLTICLKALLKFNTGIKRDLITATAVISGISTFAFGFFTNLPVALAYDSYTLSLFGIYKLPH